MRLLLIFFSDARYVGRLFVKGSGKPAEVLTKLNEMAGLGPDEEIELYEVSLIICFCCLIVFYLSHLLTVHSLLCCSTS